MGDYSLPRDADDYFLPDFEPEEIGWPHADSTMEYFLRADEQYEQDRMEMPDLFGTAANTARYEGE